MTLVHDLPLNSKVLVWRKSSNWNRPYRLLAVENKMYYIQLPSGPTSFRSTSIKPYFRPKDNYNVKLDKLETPAKPDELEAPVKPDELEATAKPGKLEATVKLDELGAPAELNKIEVPLPTLEVP